MISHQAGQKTRTSSGSELRAENSSLCSMVLVVLLVSEVGAVVVRVANAPHENDSMNNRSPVPLLNELLVVLGVASLLIRPYKAQNQPRALGMPNGDSAARQPHTQHISSF